ncbi:Protein arginine N-methyltransferase 5 [Pseudolycoriella hygida]|uniref:Protein arginine N-methyltransferase n=1 Tax=Pseudolycoriella hygida TaxID=35572 RepID=A0A9Q0N3P7_9DIPT|nr:Protein arginine N-methyltransferase 5 [Pseudolycoriella hygida]
MVQRNAICLYSEETTSDLRAGIQKMRQNGYDKMVSSLVVSKMDYMTGLYKGGNSFSRSDLILDSKEWSESIIAKINDEFDCDSKNDEIRKNSEKILTRELSFADHVIPYVFTLLKVTSLETTNLVRVVMSKNLIGQILIEIPMVNPHKLVNDLCEERDTGHEDPWCWWNTFRAVADFNCKLSIALELSTEIPSKLEISRWLGEPIGSLIIPSHLFVRGSDNKPMLSRPHELLILSFKETINEVAFMVKCNIEDMNLGLYSNYLRHLLEKNPVTDIMYGSDDVLQDPLQPLYDNLDTNTYEIFETDPVKYMYYQNAIERALIDMIPTKDIQTETAIIMIVGAGRGPLIRSSLNASVKTGRKIKLYAIEKNPHAINTLHALVDELWSDKDIEIIAKDMRNFHPVQKADILVSELIGSFGDNELSPECLDGAQKLLKPSGISIPSKYTSYINPVMSFKIHNLIRLRSHMLSPRDRISTSQNRLEQMYVVYMKNVFHIANPETLFEFSHPNRSDHIDNSRFKTVSFETDIDCVLTGFAGYFDAVLYKDIVLSIHPLSHTRGLWSWFPAYFPISEPIQLKKGDSIVTNFWRCTGQHKVWYEWSISKPIITYIHNQMGTHYAIHL